MTISRRSSSSSFSACSGASWYVNSCQEYGLDFRPTGNSAIQRPKAFTPAAYQYNLASGLGPRNEEGKQGMGQRYIRDAHSMQHASRQRPKTADASRDSERRHCFFFADEQDGADSRMQKPQNYVAFGSYGLRAQEEAAHAGTGLLTPPESSDEEGGHPVAGHRSHRPALDHHVGDSGASAKRRRPSTSVPIVRSGHKKWSKELEDSYPWDIVAKHRGVVAPAPEIAPSIHARPDSHPKDLLGYFQNTPSTRETDNISHPAPQNYSRPTSRTSDECLERAGVTGGIIDVHQSKSTSDLVLEGALDKRWTKHTDISHIKQRPSLFKPRPHVESSHPESPATSLATFNPQEDPAGFAVYNSRRPATSSGIFGPSSRHASLSSASLPVNSAREVNETEAHRYHYKKIKDHMQTLNNADTRTKSPNANSDPTRSRSVLKKGSPLKSNANKVQPSIPATSSLKLPTASETDIAQHKRQGRKSFIGRVLFNIGGSFGPKTQSLPTNKHQAELENGQLFVM